MRRTKKMRASDGGGIRGILPAMMLAELARRAQPPVGALFDLLAGTSTGGILALGLTVPGEPGKPKDRAADLVGLYAQEGRTLCARSVWHRVRSVGGVAEEKYPSEGIEATLARSVGEARRADARADVLVTSDAIARRRPYFFKSFRAKTAPRAARPPPRRQTLSPVSSSCRTWTASCWWMAGSLPTTRRCAPGRRRGQSPQTPRTSSCCRWAQGT